MTFDNATHTLIMIGGFGIFGAELANATGLVIGMILGACFIVFERRKLKI